jgi:DHA1 family bicyclomycin/chloramphenicol resistance-like MFS transporter
VVARAIVRDLFEGPQAQRVMATVQMLFGIAPAIAPIIGGFLLGIHWQAIFIFLALYSGFAFFAVAHYLPETMPPEKRMPLSAKQVIKDYRIIFSDAEYFRLVFSISANFAGFFLYVIASPMFLVKHLGLSAQQFGYMFIPTVCGMMIGSYLAKRAAGLYTRQQVVQWAYAWMSFTVAGNVIACYFLSHTLWLILPIAIFNVGMALAMPVLSIAALDRHPKIRGTAASGQAFMQMFLSSVSSGVVASLVWDSTFAMACAMAAYCFVGWLVIRQSHLWRHT